MDRRAATAVGASSRGADGALSIGAHAGKGQRRARLRLVGLILVFLIVFAMIAAGGYVLLHHRPKGKPSTGSKTSMSNMPSYFSSLNSQDKINYYIAQKNYTAAEAIYNGQLKAANTADARAQANIGLSGIYTTTQNYQSAYTYALKAYGNEVTEQTATAAAGAATNAGDKAGAVKYYQVAIGLLSKANLPSDQYDYDLRVLQADIQEVGQ